MKYSAVRLEHSQKTQPDQHVGQLRGQLHHQIDHGGNRREESRYAGKRERTGAKHIAAHLRERQNLGRTIAHQPRPDELLRARARHTAPERPPCEAEERRHRQMRDNHDGESSEAERLPGRCDRRDAEMHEQPAEHGEARRERQCAEEFHAGVKACHRCFGARRPFAFDPECRHVGTELLPQGGGIKAGLREVVPVHSIPAARRIANEFFDILPRGSAERHIEMCVKCCQRVDRPGDQRLVMNMEDFALRARYRLRSMQHPRSSVR